MAELPPGVTERTVTVNGIDMYFVEKGVHGAPVVLFLHGFPECWYSWRHQIVDLGDRGFHCVAPDLRGFGKTTSPTEVSSYSCDILVKDVIGLIDALGVTDVFLVGHDWGAILGWYVCMFYPERINAYVSLSVPFLRRDPKIKTLDWMRSYYWDNYYMYRFQSPTMEKQMEDAGGAPYVLKNILTLRKPGPPIFEKDDQYKPGFNPDMPDTLPPWLKIEDLNFFINQVKNNKSGFTGGLNYYRNLNENWYLTDPKLRNSQMPPVKVPIEVKHVLFIAGELDPVITSLGLERYIKDTHFKNDVPGLVMPVTIQPGVGHFNNQEAAKEVTDLIGTFLGNIKREE